jgi:hypothetical protein
MCFAVISKRRIFVSSRTRCGAGDEGDHAEITKTVTVRIDR